MPYHVAIGRSAEEPRYQLDLTQKQVEELFVKPLLGGGSVFVGGVTLPAREITYFQVSHTQEDSAEVLKLLWNRYDDYEERARLRGDKLDFLRPGPGEVFREGRDRTLDFMTTPLSSIEGLTMAKSRSHITPVLKLFVSHSSKDTELVKLLISLLRSALNLKTTEIRCTSVDGYRLSGGANTMDDLRREVHDAQAFIGVISPASLDSLYVAFELGARWGAHKHLLPILVPGADPKMLSGPLAGINALRCDRAGQLHQLIDDLAKQLDLTAEPPAAFQDQIDQIANYKPSHPDFDTGTSTRLLDDGRLGAGDANLKPQPQHVQPAGSGFKEDTLKVMDFFFQHGGELSIEQVASHLRLSKSVTEFHFDELTRRRFLRQSQAAFGNHSGYYELTSEGRKYVMENHA
jgi:hypothetical protein